MINFELYKIFVYVAKEENLTRASEKLNLTQPAVTKHIKNLENILETKLFTRSNHGIKLTKQGEELYEKIKDAIEILINVEKQTEKERNINLGIHSTILNKIFNECMSNYYKTNTKSGINTFNLDNAEMITKLKNAELDIIFSKKMQNINETHDITFIKIGTWNDVLISNKNHKLANKKITIEQLKKQKLYMPKRTSETTKNFLESTNHKYEDFPNINHMTYKTILEVVKNSDGIGLITKEFLTEELPNTDVKILETEFKIQPVEFGIYINKNNKFQELKNFIKVIKEYFKEK